MSFCKGSGLAAASTKEASQLTCCYIFLLGRWRFFPVSSRSSLFQALRNSCRKKSTAPKKIIPNVAVCDKNTKESANALDKLFSSQQQASILHVLNTASNKELEAFKLLRGRKSINIVEHREKYGPFQNLESLMDVPLFQYKTAVQVCNSILCPETGAKRRKSQENRLLKKLIKPEIERERLKVYTLFLTSVILPKYLRTYFAKHYSGHQDRILQAAYSLVGGTRYTQVNR